MPRPLSLVLVMVLSTCAVPRPAPPEQVVPAPPAGRSGPAVAPSGRDSPPTVAPPPAPRVPSPARGRQRVSLQASWAGPRTFASGVVVHQELFRLVATKGGRFAFCLNGTKPPVDPFVFQVLVKREDGVHRVDFVTAVGPAESRFTTCATMFQNEQPIRVGELLTVEAGSNTRGPLVLTLTMDELQPQ